jgi:hypothetical protein
MPAGAGRQDLRAGELADRLADRLEAHSAVASYSAASVAVRLSVEATSAVTAADQAVGLVVTAAEDPSVQPSEVAKLEIMKEEALEASLRQRNFPTLLGVAEVANVLEVSKQRVSELRRTPSFPPPITQLRAGPVWLEDTITGYLRSWKRQGGRPARR